MSWRRERVWAAALVSLAAALLGPAVAAAQPDRYVRVSFSAAQVFDGNINAAAESRHPEGDLISRVDPALEAGWAARPVTVAARYVLHAERFLNHPGLSDAVAGQQADVAVRFLATRRLGVDVEALHATTATPAEFNLASGLTMARVPARRRGLRSGLTYDWTRRTALIVDYAWTSDALERGHASATHGATVRIDHGRGRRQVYRAAYRVRHIGFDAGAPDLSHLVTAGLVHEIASFTALEIDAGPYLTSGSIRPEVSALLRHELRKGDVTVGYSRTQATAIGEITTIDVNQLALGGSYRPRRGLSLSLSPVFARSRRADAEAEVLTLDTAATLDVGRRLSLSATSRIGRQSGTFRGPYEEIPIRMLTIAIGTALPRSSRTPAQRTQVR